LDINLRIGYPVTFVKSNYFPVQDIDNFKQFCEYWGLGYQETYVANEILVGFIANKVPENHKLFQELIKDLQKDHLTEKGVAIIIESGFEIPTRNIFWAIAFTQNEMKIFDIDQIYKQAESLGDILTRCHL